MKQVLNITKALSDETRLRILMLLKEQELCVCQIVEVFSLANSTISKHLSILSQAELIQSDKKGRWVFYRLSDDTTGNVFQSLEWIEKLLEPEQQIIHDAEQLKKILSIDPNELCQRQNKR